MNNKDKGKRLKNKGKKAGTLYKKDKGKRLKGNLKGRHFLNLNFCPYTFKFRDVTTKVNTSIVFYTEYN
ncbi:MAG: hypothetical protein A3H98_13790 [Bacteroidetes bacterium RIFCSPLOWO2_02_FULL_36_8]|nr:MAG: hypothetical protein A3H98_13790 [Bacteroidetes bacterium RIFCSPLOWO2_02_FULL_36_8]OFY72003.1 MAG: hypothetical protein A3G23_00210 [Bacteroidetes bacterium RIFCSPLOWO2_12_FULL_37_12]